MFPKIFAHRGLSSKAPENTLSAFKESLCYEIDGIEFDVQMSKDNKLVVIHDERLERTTNGKGFLIDYTYDELSRLDAGSWFSDKFKGEKIPLLEEVLELLMKHNIIINIELKNSLIKYENIEREVIAMIKDFKILNRTIISSFNYYSLRKVRLINSEINIAVLCEALMYNPLEYLSTIGAKAIHTSKSTINKKLVAYLNDNGINTLCYTVNDEYYFNKMFEMGVSGIFTDFPKEMLELRSKKLSGKSLNRIVER